MIGGNFIRVLITGAHFTPALAVIEELKKNYQVEIIYVGRKTTLEGDSSASVESKVLPKLGVQFISIITGRLQKSFTLYTIPSLLKIPLGLLQAFYIILIKKPDVVLSFGGYVAVPMIFAAWLFSIPIIIHEQTLVCGLAHKIGSLFADKIAISFEENTGYDTSKTFLTGNPIRDNIIRGAKVIHPRSELPLILITGGNQGSHIINQVVAEILDKLTKIANIVHVTGDNKFHDFERLEKRQNKHYLVKKWIGDEWGSVLSKADLVVSRAGINILTELAYLKKPALVIPIPFLYSDEQNKNARFFQDLGLVKTLPQSQLNKDTLLKNIKLMLSNLPSLKQEAKKAKHMVIPDAAKRLSLETMLLAQYK